MAVDLLACLWVVGEDGWYLADLLGEGDRESEYDYDDEEGVEIGENMNRQREYGTEEVPHPELYRLATLS